MKEHKTPYLLSLAVITVLSLLVFMPFIGNCPLFDWDEVNFAECAREMIVSGDYSHVQLNFRPFWEKPPLFIWLQAASMNLFGINEFAARFPNVLCSIFTLWSIFIAGARLYNIRAGVLWSAFYFCSLLPHFYFRTGIIDPWFNLFIFLSFLQFYFMLEHRGNQAVRGLSAGLFLGLAVLTKGPAALAIAALAQSTFMLYTRRWKVLLQWPFYLYVLSTLFVASSWFLVEWLKGNAALIHEFIDYQVRLFETKDAGHGGPFYYHFVVLLLGCFPASLVFINALAQKKQGTEKDGFRSLMICLLLSVLLIFSIVETKIVHYSSLCYFPITLLAADYFSRQKNNSFPLWSKVIFWFTTALLSVGALLLGLAGLLIPYLLKNNLIADRFAAENLKADVNWSGLEPLLALVMLAAVILVYMAIKRNSQQLLFAGLTCSLAFVSLTINIIAPKAELYTQHAAIEFYKSCANRSCHLETHGFKSYAYLFYGNRRPEDYQGTEQKRYIEKQLDLMVSEGHSRIKSYATANQLWMEHGVVDRPAFIVARISDQERIMELTRMKKLYDMNGYVFFVKMPPGPAK